jgi:hypothetical protein
MAQTTYDYPFSDFGSALPVPPHKVDTDRLMLEIRQSAIVIALDGVTTANDICSIIFKDPLAIGDVGILDIIVATHNGEPLPNDIPAPVQLYTGTGQPVPHGANNIPVFATTKSDATKKTLYSFDWTDKTTW